MLLNISNLTLQTLCGVLAVGLLITLIKIVRDNRRLRENAQKLSVLDERLRHQDSLLQERLHILDQQADELRQSQSEGNRLREELGRAEARLSAEREASQEKLRLLEEAQTRLTQAFKALSADALQANNRSFLELAQASLAKFQEAAKGDLTQRQQAISNIVAPLKESLSKVDLNIQQMEKARQGAYEGLSQKLLDLSQSQARLQSETANLVKALRAPTVRGRWGEIQLKRVVELAGMIQYCDFVEQQSVSTDNGILRPDMVIQLPNDKQIVVDSKAPLAAYLEALESEDPDTRRDHLQDHARQVRTHLQQLSSKNYWSQFPNTPEFVILFLPGETFFSAALEQDPGLIEAGVNQNVILATPTTLIALLKAVAYGWRQEKLTENAQQISELGKSLYERIATLVKHFGDMKKGLDKAIGSYNKAVGTMESRVLVSARRFRELEAAPGEELPTVEPIEVGTRNLEAPELPQQDE